MIRLLLAAAILAAGPGVAQESSRLESLKTWFKHLRQGLMESSVDSYNKSRKGVTAVAAVRGAKQASANPDKPDWSTGNRSKKAAVKKERQELASAAEHIVLGKFAEGRAALDAFDRDHPSSKLAPEAATMRAKLRELETLAAKPAEPSQAEAPKTEQ